MGRVVSIGEQDFVALREGNYFYIDKTDFIREWWQSGDSVTMLMRPRRFGKTLNLNMLRAFFSVQYAGRGEELFGDLKVWQDAAMRSLQGTYPVIFLSFAALKANSFTRMRQDMRFILSELYAGYRFLLEGEPSVMTASDREYIENQIVFKNIGDSVASIWSLLVASGYLTGDWANPDTLADSLHYAKPKYNLRITNRETLLMFEELVSRWFAAGGDNYSDFIEALLQDNIRGMNNRWG